MKGEILFEKMSDISDEYIAEAALASPVQSAGAKRNPFASLSRALNSGLGVACICFVVAIAAVVGMVAWGRMGTGIGPAGNPSDRFDFSYEIYNPDASLWNGYVCPGDSISVNTTIVNRGDAFSYTGSSSEFCAHARFVLQGDSTQALTGVAAFTDDIGTFKVETGEEGIALWHFVIPEDATPGVYDLVLSYDGEQETFSGALYVGVPFTAADTFLFFGYDPFLDNPVYPGSLIHLNTFVINMGDPFIFEGSSVGFVPTAALIHEETGYRIEGEYITTKDIQRITVNTGDRGEIGQGFNIPGDAPTGVYGLELSCHGESVIIPGVLTVAIRTRPDTPPYLEAGHPFSFGYEPFDEAVMNGGWIKLTTWVVNEGDPFTFVGSSYNGYAPDALLVHRETGFVINCNYMQTDDEAQISVATGDVGQASDYFQIDDDAPAGEYDLHLSFADQEQVFENALTIAIRTSADMDPPYLEDGHPFSFGYEPFDGLAVLGDQIEITAWVVNEGDSFSVKGTPVIRFAPFARLVHRETGFEIWCRYIRDYDEVEYSVDAGYVGRSTSEFHILANTPAGEYDLYLSLLYEDQKYVFENVLTVAVP